jgi:hypothetical protein
MSEPAPASSDPAAQAPSAEEVAELGTSSSSSSSSGVGPDVPDLTEEGRTATALDAALELRLQHAVALSEKDGKHAEAADLLSVLLKMR